MQQIRRIAVQLAQRRIQPAHVIGWSPWRRAYQAVARGLNLIDRQLCFSRPRHRQKVVQKLYGTSAVASKLALRNRPSTDRLRRRLGHPGLLMRLDPLVRNYPAFVDELDAVIRSDTTRFYLDTSLLLWLVRVGQEARTEFFAWAAGRPVRVPVWVAHEFHRHVVGGTLADNLGKSLSDVEAKYDEFSRLAAERVEEVLCRRNGFSDSQAFLVAVNQARVQLTRFRKAIDGNEASMQGAAEAVIQFINERLLTSDVASILDRLSAAADLRFSHHVPPGFQDKKTENRYGDLIIWEELVADLVAAQLTRRGRPRVRKEVTTAVLISRDKKTDWVSGAHLVQMDVKPFVQKPSRDEEMDVTLPHPLLLHEFQRRTGAAKLYVTHPAFLSSMLDLSARRRSEASPARAWLKATHRPDFGVKVEDRLQELSQRRPIAPAPLSMTPITPVDLGTVTARDLSAAAVQPEVRSQLTALPADRQGFVSQSLAMLAGGQISPIRLGRIVAELTLIQAAGWPAQLPTLLDGVRSQINEAAAAEILAAFLASGFFDVYGDLRDIPSGDVIRPALVLETEEGFQAAFVAIARLLHLEGAQFPYTIGKGRPRVAYRVELTGGQGPLHLRDVRLANQTALAGPMPETDPRSLTTLLGREPEMGCMGLELRNLLASEFLIPPDLLDTAWDNKKITWSTGTGLVRLDPMSEGGLNADAEF